VAGNCLGIVSKAPVQHLLRPYYKLPSTTPRVDRLVAIIQSGAYLVLA